MRFCTMSTFPGRLWIYGGGVMAGRRRLVKAHGQIMTKDHNKPQKLGKTHTASHRALTTHPGADFPDGAAGL